MCLHVTTLNVTSLCEQIRINDATNLVEMSRWGSVLRYLVLCNKRGFRGSIKRPVTVALLQETKS